MGISNPHRLLPVLGLAFVLGMTASCEDEVVTSVHIDTPGKQTTIEWSVDYQAESFWGIEESAGNVVAIGESGAYEFDGSAWNRIAGPLTFMHDASLASDGTLFALSGNSVYRRDGHAWTNIKTFQFSAEFADVSAIWAHSADQAFVVTTEEFEAGGYYYWTENTLHHFDGTSWQVGKLIASSGYTRDMWGTSPSNIYFARSDGLYHFDGTSASKIDVVGSTELRTVGGTSASDIYAIRSDRTVLLYDGVAPDILLPPTTLELTSARRIGGDMFVCGRQGACYRYAGGAWHSVGVTGAADRLTGVWGTSPADLVTVGGGGILRLENGVWHRTRGGSPVALRDIWVADTGEIFVVGDEGVIEIREDGVWHPMGFGEYRQNLFGVFGTSRDNVYAVGAGGRILHYDGNAWLAMTSGTAVTLTSVWAQGTTAVAVGDMTIVKLSNGAWTPMPAQMPARFKLQDVWGASENDLFAVGYVTFEYEGTILHFDGTSWQVVDDEMRPRMFGIWGFAPDDVFAVGESFPQDGPTRYWAGAIYHFDGVSWTRMHVGEDIASLSAVWGASAEELIGVGGRTLVLYDGASWTSAPLYGFDPSGLNKIHAAEGSDVFGLGHGGVVRFNISR